MKKDAMFFWRAVFIVIVLLVAVDLILGLTADRLAANMPAQSGQIAKDNYRLHKMTDEISSKERVLMKSCLYRYNGKLQRIVSSYLRPEPLDGGYLPLFGSSIDTTIVVPTKEKEDTHLNEYSKANFERVLEKYKAAGVPLIVVCSPRFRSLDNNRQLQALCNQHGVPFIDMADDSFFNAHPELFKDADHLNNDGAHKYTSLLFEHLKPYLKRL